ncbi:UBA/THIF-type NAD/FAD binding protein (fragment) [Syntrophobacter sp. SbD1]
MQASKHPKDSPGDHSIDLSIDQTLEMIENSQCKVRLLDIREERELPAGRIEGALHLPLSMLDARVEEQLPDKTKPVVLYCSSGGRSRGAAARMKSMGYRDVKSMAGGFKAWVEAGREIVVKGAMAAPQINRYSRQMLLSEVGEEGQLKLFGSRVLIVGAGGLGSPIALYLAGGGIGALGIVDFDTVNLSNIHRQVLYSTADVGKLKTEAAIEKLREINPDVAVTTCRERFSPENALKLVKAYDVVVDGSDNLQTKFLLNDAAFFAGKPYIFGGAIGFNGQASVFHPREGGPCLRCMFPDIPPPGTAPT